MAHYSHNGSACAWTLAQCLVRDNHLAEMGFQVQRDEGKLREYFAEAPTDISLGDIDLQRIPSHVSIIMDGNGRWAQARGLDRSEGHVAGVDSLRETWGCAT